ncbi:LLM class flavin-dependent oxidoreductase [Pseudofrankia asymbiotica]|uniref:Luciferase-like domain-containing protein n=1 Tax=Pseudofrankia asymbiotica TaxID=1834516 RepID=A0A1V2I0M0_9ACTN|nr:LLM class flavin-dependent oxidoreductase [Pseudofrankia asymbiotica]ONH22878.1 hypothetical protein BL253_34425 [Pseudofrankia asymbiotica]
MKVGVRIPPCRPVRETAGLAATAERQGFDSVWFPDSQLLWRDVWSTLTGAALATERVGVGVLVTNPITRHPSVTASAARTVEELAPGRTRVVLGAGDSAITHAALPQARTAQLADAVDVIRTLLRGDTVGDVPTYRLHDPGPRPVPVYIAASGPRNLALAGRLADGVVVGGAAIERDLALAQAGAKEAGRDPADLDVVVTKLTVVSDDPRAASVLKPLCLRIAQIGGAPMFAAAGFPIDAPPHDLSHGDLGHPEDWDAAVEVASQWVSDEAAQWYARTRCLFGTPQEIAAQLLDLARAGVTEVSLAHPGAFQQPVDLISTVGAEVLPLLRAASE